MSPSHQATCPASIPIAPPTWLDRGRIPCLDGLRAMAILLVIFAHSSFPGDHWLPLRALRGRCGFLGVQLFFVLSGFLITTLMLREVQRRGRVHLGHFYLRRALRILPVYTVYLLLLAILTGCGWERFDGRHWLAAATYTVNFLPAPLPSLMSHLWSLCVEEHFYLLWPLLMAVLPLRWCLRAIPACLVMAFLLRWILLAYPGVPIDLLTFTRIDDIAVGCGLAFLAREPAWRRRLDGLITPGRLVLLLLVFAVSQVCFSRVIGPSLLPPILLRLGLALANDLNSLTIAVLMWAVLTRPSGLWGRLLNQPAAVGLGVLSYSIYLWHLLLCEREGPAWLSSFPQNLLGIFLIALLSYRLIEKPFLTWKDRLAVDRPTVELYAAENRRDRLRTLWFRFSGKPARPSTTHEKQTAPVENPVERR
jgi:peptidoglycan/LPS O-acetylase OafA/YrhL